jgi:hypothetical protein
MSNPGSYERIQGMLGLPFVAYMAHPYGGDFGNIVKARTMATKISEKYPDLVIVNPLDNFQFMRDVDEVNVLQACSTLLAKCDILILTGDWHESVGCRTELEVARNFGLARIEMNSSMEIKAVD